MDSRLNINVSPFIDCEDSTWQRGDFPVLVAETHSWTLADGILNQDGYHRQVGSVA